MTSTSTAPGSAAELLAAVRAWEKEAAAVEIGRVVAVRDWAQVREWCQFESSTVTVRPVLDLAEHHPVDSYEIPNRIRRQVQLRDPHCVFPFCQRRAERCDVDHPTPPPLPGRTGLTTPPHTPPTGGARGMPTDVGRVPVARDERRVYRDHRLGLDTLAGARSSTVVEHRRRAVAPATRPREKSIPPAPAHSEAGHTRR